MVLCAASGCNNRHKKDSLISFFRFPSNPQTRKAWTHYCKRWDFLPSTGHRLCSAHFTNACYDRDPEVLKNLEGCPTMKPKLRPNAVPDIPLTQPTTAEPRPPIPKWGAYEKRRKADILQLAYCLKDRQCRTLRMTNLYLLLDYFQQVTAQTDTIEYLKFESCLENCCQHRPLFNYAEM
ncbi:THAP domain-containing protein 1-like [Mytilus californianus]|uniref:THAP domain-containing protein 1-like n=1 Tax=Mytilus californianus TaxID=6549 RepID=UPI0022476799|nr:THAP domain-containing protein 1-like [Mytilus californianus]